MNNKLLKAFFSGTLSLILFLGTFIVAFAGTNSTTPVAYSGSYLTTITGLTSSTGDPVDGSTNIDYNPTLKIEFTKNVVNSTVWDINSHAFTLTDSSGNTIDIDVTRIPDEGDNSNPNEKQNIFVTPKKSLTPLATYILTINGNLTAKDLTTLGQNKTITFTVKADTEKPTISGADDLSINAGDTFNPLNGVTATDNLDGDITSKIVVTGAVDNTKQGVYPLTYSVTDNAGNATTITRNITVNAPAVPTDTVKPTISGADDLSINVGYTFNPLSGVTAIDNIDGDITSKITVTGTVDNTQPGVYPLTYSVTDNAGNATTVTRNITVNAPAVPADTLKPTISGADDLSINVGDTFNPLSGVTATDNIDGDITSKIVVTGTVDNTKQGVYPLTYSVTDNAGNATTTTRNITVMDPVTFVGAYLSSISGNVSTTGDAINGSRNVDINPTIKLIFTKNVVNSTVWDINSQAFTLTDSDGNPVSINVSRIPDQGDNANTDEKRNIFVTLVNSLTPLKTYILTIKGSLTANNTTTLGQNESITFTVKAQSVNVKPVKPSIIGANDKTIKVGQAFNALTGVTAIDNIDGNITSKMIVTGKVDNSKSGSYSLTYSVKNSAGLETIITRAIKVIDSVKPVITGVSNKTIALNSKFNSLTGIKATDNSDGNLTNTIKVSGIVNSKKKGTYTLTYTVKDKSGNVTTVSRKITVVIDKIRPVLSGTTSKTIKLHSTFNPKTSVTARDNVDGTLTNLIKIKGTVNTKKKGTYTLTYSVTDKSGNRTTITRKITVK